MIPPIKGTAMLYKTIIQGLLEQNPLLHERLRRERAMLTAIDHYSMELKRIHETEMDRLFIARPDSEETQIASEAMEIAVLEMEERLLAGSKAEDDSPLSLDAAMAYIRRRMPPG